MNPIELAARIEERYRRYLETTFYFRDLDLRESFRKALGSGHLSKGPFLEAIPVFKRGQTPRVFFQNLLGSPPDEGFLSALHGDRALYKHQETAIQKVFRGRNVVVATGTGSGKTEAFLYPILLSLYQEFLSGKLGPGVRALILYPMNALANDQRERLGTICKRLKESGSGFRFTFGQYIGETPEDEHDSKGHAQDYLLERKKEGYSVIEDGKVVHGELVLRSEMRETPPHILLTNYSMLEYLLLRPSDSPLFDNGLAKWWTFLVLDEAHQYRGSRGTEMAMLLRRLKQRLREGGCAEPFRCIATSATLMGGENDRGDVARFASDLFGEEFTPDDVILGETETIPKPGPYRLAPGDYGTLLEELRKGGPGLGNRLSEMAGKLGLSHLDVSDSSRALVEILKRDGRAVQVRCVVTERALPVRDVANQVFDDVPDEEERVCRLAELVELLLRTVDPTTDAPLFSARYHLFLRSLEGAFVSYWPQKKVYLERKSVGKDTVAFEVAICRECGQHYFVGRLQGRKFVEAIRDPAEASFGATFLRPIENGIGDDEGEDGRAEGKKLQNLCIRCAELAESMPKCGHDDIIRVIREDPPEDEDRADQIAKCGACGYSAAGRDPVRELVHGADGPHAVIATTLFQSLPEDRRKVLAFADGRQEAAFFAWYLEDSYKDILSRNLLLRIAKSFNPYPREGVSLSTIVDRACRDYRDCFKGREADDEITIRKNIWRAVYREFLTDEQRISLEGVGLVRWEPKLPDRFRIPPSLTEGPWSLTEDEARSLVLILLNTARADRAMEIRTETNVSLNWTEIGLQASQTRLRIGDPKLEKNVRSWDGRTGRRVRFLAKLLMRSGLSEQEALDLAVKALREIWGALKQSDEGARSPNDRLLRGANDTRVLNPDWWRVHLIVEDDTVFQCDTCGRLQTISVREICPRHRCLGTLRPVRVRDLEPNHYRGLYQENLPGLLRVEEHTAQLDKERAREFQREFREGKIHVLSCSTTFELGVDLGDLDTIFLRNVPPEAFNYAQRVGRAGRRPGRPGFAITYCRRAPHDLYHFAEPERVLSGKARPPVLSLSNEKILLRHVSAVALSSFFRVYPERFKTVQNLCKDLTSPSATSDFAEFLRNHRRKLEGALSAIVPHDMVLRLGLGDGSWIEKISGKDSRFADAELEVSNDYMVVKDLEKDTAAKGDYKTAEWAKDRAETIASEDVLSFLSRKAVIPKYGFPVDVVELDTQRTQRAQEACDVLLQRDLSIAISEYAPTSKLVANKKEWVSYGLKRVAGKEWPKGHYKRCPKHNVFLRWDSGQPEPKLPCGCRDEEPASTYIVPSFGFVTERDKPREPRGRAARAFTTRPYFVRALSPDPGNISMPSDCNDPVVEIVKASPGLMIMLCEGKRREGFYVCSECGAGFRRRPGAQHKNAQGQNCSGTLEQISLAHEFVTDVLQVRFLLEQLDGTDPVWFAYSLAYALVEGTAEILDVPSTDLSAAITYDEQYPVAPIILYDNVPGGAGLVSRLEKEDMFKFCLKAALERVDGKCGCDESTSCYGCLRSYRNQFAHHQLQRGPVKRYLEAMLSKWYT
jgi:hypothetical protein